MPAAASGRSGEWWWWRWWVALMGLAAWAAALAGGAAKKWSLGFMSRRLADVIAAANPSLSAEQRTRLAAMLSGALSHIIYGTGGAGIDWPLLRERLAAIVALACPHRDTADLLTALLDAVAAWDAHAPSAPPMPPPAFERPPTAAEPTAPPDWWETGGGGGGGVDADMASKLVRRHGVKPAYAARMPRAVAQAVAQALREAEADPECGRCPITLEQLVRLNATLRPDVVALLQPATRTQPPHAFLYRGSALREWLAASPQPTNPQTRSQVHADDLFPLT
eukprot:jgi/Chlat1/1139/Chrsp112S01616